MLSPAFRIVWAAPETGKERQLRIKHHLDVQLRTSFIPGANFLPRTSLVRSVHLRLVSLPRFLPAPLVRRASRRRGLHLFDSGYRGGLPDSRALASWARSGLGGPIWIHSPVVVPTGRSVCVWDVVDGRTDRDLAIRSLDRPK